MRIISTDSSFENSGGISVSIDARAPAGVHLMVILATAFLLSVVSHAFADAPPHRMAQVVVNIANLRAAPSMESPLAGKVYRGTVLHIEENRGDWYRVRRGNGSFAWAHSTVLEFLPSAQTGSIPDKVIEEIRFETGADRVERVVFFLSEFFTPETFALEGDKPRLVCDFYGARLGERISGPMEINARYVDGIRFGIYDEPASRVRVVLDLMPDKDYSVEQFYYQKNNRYLIVLSENSP